MLLKAKQNKYATRASKNHFCSNSMFQAATKSPPAPRCSNANIKLTFSVHKGILKFLRASFSCYSNTQSLLESRLPAAAPQFCNAVPQKDKSILDLHIVVLPTSSQSCNSYLKS